MLVAIRLVRVDARRHREVDRRVLGIRLIELNRAVEIGEAATHLREQIANLESRLGVGFVYAVRAYRSRRCHRIVYLVFPSNH